MMLVELVPCFPKDQPFESGNFQGATVEAEARHVRFRDASSSAAQQISNRQKLKIEEYDARTAADEYQLWFLGATAEKVGVNISPPV